MQKILVLGAGLSSGYLIRYLAEHAAKEEWTITVADANIELAQDKALPHKQVHAIALDINNKEARIKHIKNADIVVSLLPPLLHTEAAKDCVQLRKHLVTASYVSDEMKALHEPALKAGVLLLNETGLDPGIDHLSAMQMIHDIQDRGGVVTTFKSYCGGLVAPEYDNNPWNYKFTWNPRNVVLAGQATAKYLEDGMLKFIPPNRIFTQTEEVHVHGYGEFETYANRDSLSYIEPYGIGSAKTVLRGTMRKKDFCKAWNELVKLGLTDDSYHVPQSHALTYRELLCSFVSGANDKNLEVQLARFLNIPQSSATFKKIKWLGLLEPVGIGLDDVSPAQILQHLLQEKWKLEKDELDMIVMKHEIGYRLKGRHYKEHSSLVVIGESQQYTAMAKTVGLPMAIATRLILQGKIKARGVQIPLDREFYVPILKELAKYHIQFVG